MDVNDWDFFVSALENVHQDLQSIKHVNNRIEEREQFIIQQIYAIQELRDFLQKKYYKHALFGHIQAVWEAHLYFVLLRHDLFLVDVNIQAQKYIGLCQGARFPLLSYLGNLCHEFLTRFNTTLLN